MRIARFAVVVVTAVLAGCTFSGPGGAVPDGAPDGPPDVSTGGRVVDSHLIGMWRFAEGGGTTVGDTVKMLRPEYTETAMDLTIEPGSAFQWVEGGLQIDGIVQIRTPSSSLLRPHMTPDVTGNQLEPGSHAVTLEVWVTPADAAQGAASYASIFSLSPNPSYCNIRIAQQGRKFLGASRTLGDTKGAGYPIATLDGAVTTTEPTHLVLVSDGTERKLYVNGQAYDSPPAGLGMPAGWTDYYRINIGNENDAVTYPRPWRGQLWFAAVYDRALTAEEIRQNGAAGHDCWAC